MRVLVVDDHAIMRRGVRDIISATFEDVEFGEAGDEATAVALAATSAWDLAIIDLSLPHRGGLDLLRELKARDPRLRLLVLSMHEEREYVIRALRAGAHGYLTKKSAAEALAEAVRTLLAGKIYLHPSIAGEVALQLVAGDEDVVGTLSDRELQVLRLIGQGRSVKQVSADLALSEKTVSTYRTRLLKKLGFTGTAELIRFAVERGIL